MQTFIETHIAAQMAIGLSVPVSLILESAVRRRALPPEAGAANAKDGDRGTKWVVIGAVVVALSLGWTAALTVRGAQFPGNGWIYVGAGFLLMSAGEGLRLWATTLLGRFFQLVVVIQEGHRVVTGGPYRVIRHPAYAGTLLLVAGIGLALGNWLSLAILLVVTLLGHVPRIRVEERALEQSLGDAYRSYESATSRLIPGLW
jgi:protein-S-isoprenylcysteine O-methyltransferase Ste14